MRVSLMYKIVMLKKSCTIEEPFSANKMYAPIARGKMVKSKKIKIPNNSQIIKPKPSPALYKFFMLGP